MLMRIIGESTSTRVLMGDLFLSSHCRHSMACRDTGGEEATQALLPQAQHA